MDKLIYNKDAFLNGQLLLIDKPLEWTSFQAVNKLKHLIKRNLKLKQIKIGHAGTLDPLASGLLLICTGKFTKKIESLQGMEKEYSGHFYVGATTPSYDLESEIDQQYPTEHIDNELIEKVRTSFLGEIQQIPPIFSAIKKDGKRAYELARKGKEIVLNSRKVTISDFDIQRLNENEFSFRVVCSKGTYIRSLANDFGKALYSGAYLKSLRRDRIGNYQLEDAISIETFEKNIKSTEILD